MTKMIKPHTKYMTMSHNERVTWEKVCMAYNRLEASQGNEAAVAEYRLAERDYEAAFVAANARESLAIAEEAAFVSQLR